MTFSKRAQLAFLVVAALTAAAGCNSSNWPANRTRAEAPTGPLDVGVLIENAAPSDIASVLDLHPEAKVRPLNSKHGLYEFYGVSASDIRSATGKPAVANAFFPLADDDEPADAAAKADSDLRQLLNGWPPQEGQKVAHLRPCRKADPLSPSPRAPGLSISFEGGGPAKSNGDSFELGPSVRISIRGNREEKDGGTATRRLDNRPTPVAGSTIVIFPPNLSRMDHEFSINGDEAVFTPDALGVYDVLLVTQDMSQVCSTAVSSFLVTANRPYLGSLSRGSERAREEGYSTLNLSRFAHLTQVSARQAWKISEGERIVIAIIDTGVNYNHPSLAANIKINEDEVPDNQIDDDRNGYVDDVFGYDFVNADRFPFDDDGHGTHVAGLAAGREFGLAPRAKILPIKALNSLGGDFGSVAAAIRYAVDQKARIVNLSMGAAVSNAHPALASSIRYAADHGVLVTVAAGNGDPSTGFGFDLDQHPIYPASLGMANLVTVAAFDEQNVLSLYSNFGAMTVSVVAPGGMSPRTPIFSAALENPRQKLFVGMSGTSMATPIAAGIAAQVWSLAPRLTFTEVKRLLEHSGREFADLKPVCISGRHLDALDAVTKAKDDPAARVSL